MTHTSATARVTVTLEVDVSSSWGEKCSIAQVHEQASEEAIGKIRNALAPETQGVRIVSAAPTAIISVRKP